MNTTQFDDVARSLWSAQSRRGVLRGIAVTAAGLWAARWSGPAVAQSPSYPCAPGIDGPEANCVCRCVKPPFGFSRVECAAACAECKGHITAVCAAALQPDGSAAGPPVCCADRKPCHAVCGDCPECEPWPDLL